MPKELKEHAIDIIEKAVKFHQPYKGKQKMLYNKNQ